MRAWLVNSCLQTYTDYIMCKCLNTYSHACTCICTHTLHFYSNMAFNYEAFLSINLHY